jgi:hypothetical protein
MALAVMAPYPLGRVEFVRRKVAVHRVWLPSVAGAAHGLYGLIKQFAVHQVRSAIEVNHASARGKHVCVPHDV